MWSMPSHTYFAIIADIDLKIGQKTYKSRIGGFKEHPPIVRSFMGAKRSDLVLINLAEAALKSAKWPTKV
ncbi:hypothetical protein MY8738_009692 [Beauveria namnaoensis]